MIRQTYQTSTLDLRRKAIMSHTPGPWTLADNRHAVVIESNANDFRGLSCEVDKDDYDHATAMANAHLIAAAPDLLAALIGVVRVADRATVEFDAARAAIAKATGTATTKGPDE